MPTPRLPPAPGTIAPLAAAAAAGAPDVLLLLGLTLGLFSSLTPLLPWQIGLWADSEAIALVVHGGAVLVAAGFTLHAAGAPVVIRHSLGHGFVLLPLLLAGWGVVGALTAASDPASALLGSPQTAEGPLLLVDGALFIGATRRLALTPWLRPLLGLLTALAGIAIPVVAFFSAGRIYFFGAWMVFFAISAPVATLGLLGERWPRPLRLALALAVGTPGIVLSGSITAIACGLLILPALWLLSRPVVMPGAVPTPESAPATVARPRQALILGGLALLAPLLLGLGIAALALAWGSDKPSIRAIESLWSRGHLQLALLTGFADQPWHWLTGLGWGQVGELFNRSVTASGLTLWDGSWDMMRRDIVNSHHHLLEALLAGGVPALLLVLLTLFALPWWCRPERALEAGCFALSLSTLGAMWFQLPGTAAVIAIASAALTAGRAGTLPPGLARLPLATPLAGGQKSVKTGWSRTGLALGLVTLALGVVVALLTGDALRGATLERDYIKPPAAPPLAACDAGRFRGWRAQAYLSHLFARDFKQLREATRDRPLPEPALRALANLSCLARRPEFAQSAALATLDLALRGELLLNEAHQNDRRYFPDLATDWGQKVDHYLQLAPRRNDLVIGYLVWLDRQQRLPDLFELTRRLLARDPGDPVALWYSGAALTRQPGQWAEGMRRLQRALAQGIGHRIPLDPELRRQIQEARPDGA